MKSRLTKVILAVLVLLMMWLAGAFNKVEALEPPVAPGSTNARTETAPAETHPNLIQQPATTPSWIPAERLLKWDPGVRGGIPAVPVLCELTAADLPAGGETDISEKLQSAIDGIKPPGAVLLPAGTFLLTKQVRLKSGVVLRGAGLNKTHLIVRDPGHKEWPPQGALQASGAREHTSLRVTAGLTVGSRELTLASVGNLKPGDLICVYLKDGDLGQIVRLIKVTDQTVTLEEPLRFAGEPNVVPRLSRLTTVSGVGIENLHIRRDDDSEGSIIGFFCAENCWVRDCETEMCMKYHIQGTLSRYLTVENCYVHHARNQGGGGHGYGVELDDWSADCLVQNNLFHTLRHAMIIQNGANGCVYAYNYSFDTFGSDDVGGHWFHSNDMSIHGGCAYADLYEGNVAEVGGVGDRNPAGPGITFFRNRITAPEKVLDLEHYRKLGGTYSFRVGVTVIKDNHGANIIGNTFTEKSGPYAAPISIDPSCRDDAFVEGNLIDGKLQWNKVQPGPLPASLFLAGKPAFWGAKPWPGIGADVDQRDLCPLPAQDWHARIKKAGHAVPFAE